MNRLVPLAGLLAALFVTASPAPVDIESPWGREKKQPDASQGAMVSQMIGVDSWVRIAYHRPAVKGRDLWGAEHDHPMIDFIVPMDGDPRPWRAGANEVTTIEFTDDVRVEGKRLGAGMYALFMIPRDGDWTVILQRDTNQWGSFRYDEKKDALRVDVTPVEAPHAEWLTYGFDAPGPWGATAYLHWETVKVPFKVELQQQDP